MGRQYQVLALGWQIINERGMVRITWHFIFWEPWSCLQNEN